VLGRSGAGEEGKRPRLPLRARLRTRGTGGTGPVERLVLRTPTTFRRRLIAGAVIGVAVLATVSALVIWRQYRDNQHRAVNDLDARVVLVGAVVNSYVSGGISTLDSIAAAPSVVQSQPALMDAYFKRLAASPGEIFDGGIGWVDPAGQVTASSSGASVNVADREYFQRVMKTGSPYVSSGLIGKHLKQQLVVVAVPTRNAAGRLTGVLTGGIELKSLGQSEQTRDLGFEGLTIVDRDGKLILGHLSPVADPTLLTRVRHAGTGVLRNSPGLEGGSHHIVAFTTATVPGWTIAIDRPASSVYAAARRSLILELASIGAAVIAVLVLLALVAKRSRREIEARGGHAQTWSRLTRSLGAAARPAEVADAVLEAVEDVFPDAIAVVVVDSETGEEVRAASSLPGWRRVPGDSDRLRTIAALATEGPGTRSLERERSLRDVYLTFRRKLKALHAFPIVGPGDSPIGGIAILTERTSLDATEWELLAVFVSQAAQALTRARVSEHDHELAVRLQRSLLPADLPSVPGLGLAGAYLAGGTGVEVGGDWYDAVIRPDGILQLCVGDVSGRGVAAATIMGRQRGTFRAYAYDCVSPAEIFRRMLRHVGGDEMITATCVTIDPLAGRIGYSCAGHPPPLLLDRSTGEIARLEDASAPPLGVAEPDEIVEKWQPLPEQALLALYTDGLVERRGEDIDAGIDALGETMSADPELTADGVVAAVAEAIGAPSDDVALLLGSIEPSYAFSIELPARPDILATLRRRMRSWLARVDFDDESVGEILLAVGEAVNNSIEHAYGTNGNGVTAGTVFLTAAADDEKLHLEVTDRGCWLVAEPRDERGRGFHLMNGLVDRVEVDAGAAGTKIVLERRRRLTLDTAPAPHV
jgi:anti-sigma regulatory factor (Ser/Thr protein kinase)